MKNQPDETLEELADRQKRTQFWIVALMIGIIAGFLLESYFKGPPSTANTDEERRKTRRQLKKAGASFRNESEVFNRVARFVQPSVVNISTKAPQYNVWGIPRNRQNEGTGVIINKQGHVLTNYHVVKGENARIQVTLADDRVFPGKLIGYDNLLDLALVRIDAKNLTPATLGDSSAVDVGEWVMAVGSPFGLSQSVTAGIVSALDRGKGNLPAANEGYIQTDASINPGNSGGPLVNLKGEVIGINTMILSQSGGSQGVGFAIPINTARKTVRRMQEEGVVQWGYLGVQVANFDRSGLPLIRRFMQKKFNAQVRSIEKLLKALKMDKPRGVLVLDITRTAPPAPARRAGLRPLDVILSFDGTPIDTADQMRSLVLNQKPGTTVRITFLRQGEKKTVRAEIGVRQ